MNNKFATIRPAGTAEMINRAVLGTIADAWNRYPSEVPLPKVDSHEQQLLGHVLGLLAQEGVVRITGRSVALTQDGHAAVEHASRTDHRVSELLRGASLPAEESVSSSLVLAILRVNFERRSNSKG